MYSNRSHGGVGDSKDDLEFRHCLMVTTTSLFCKLFMIQEGQNQINSLKAVQGVCGFQIQLREAVPESRIITLQWTPADSKADLFRTPHEIS